MAEYIEREAAIKAADIYAPDYTGVPFVNFVLHNLIHDRIIDIPAADVRPVVRGRWISDGPGKKFGTVVRLDKDGCPVDTCHCSECGEWLTASDEYPVIGRYCPNCGADMRGDTDGVEL